MNLCDVYDGFINGYTIYILHYAKNEIYNHRISGYTNASAIAALIKPLIDP